MTAASSIADGDDEGLDEEELVEEEAGRATILEGRGERPIGDTAIVCVKPRGRVVLQKRRPGRLFISFVRACGDLLVEKPDGPLRRTRDKPNRRTVDVGLLRFDQGMQAPVRGVSTEREQCM